MHIHQKTEKLKYTTMIQYFTATTINCECQKIRSMLEYLKCISLPFAGAVNAFLCCNLASLARRKGINGQPFQLEKVGYYKVIMIVEIQIVIGGFHSKCKELLTVGFHLNLF